MSTKNSATGEKIDSLFSLVMLPVVFLFSEKIGYVSSSKEFVENKHMVTLRLWAANLIVIFDIYLKDSHLFFKHIKNVL